MEKCVICQEEDRNIKNVCSNCKCASMHPVCYEDMLRNEINKCPTCRCEMQKNDTNLKKNNISLNIRVFQIIKNKLNSVIRSNFCYVINIICISIICLFTFYLLLGYISCMFNNDYPNVFSLKYL